MLSELQQFLRFPSISAQPAHAGDVRNCAEWLANHLRQIGLERVQVIQTPRHPMVLLSGDTHLADPPC